MSIYTPFDEQQRQNLRGISEKLDGTADLIGGWSAKSDCRQTGVSLHLKFEKKVDVKTTWEFAETLQTCPAMLNDAAAKLLAADDEIVRLRAALERITGFDPADDNGLACWNRWPSQPDRWCPTCIATEALK